MAAGIGGDAGQRQAGVPDIAYPANAMTLKPFGTDLVMAARGAGQITPVADALAMAEAFDGAENVSNAYGYYIDQFAWRDTARAVRARRLEGAQLHRHLHRQRPGDNSMIQRYGEGGPNAAIQTLHQKTQPYVTVLGDGAARRSAPG